MAYGLVQAEHGHKADATSALKQAAQMEESRDQNNKMLKQQHKVGKASSAGAGSSIGAMMAMGAGAGPVGIGAAAAIGLLGGWLVG